MSDTRLDTLKINVLSQSQYDSATKDENQLYLITDQISDVDSRYGLCSTSSSTVNKEVTIADKDFSLITGARVTVNFQNNNSATNPTLNVNQSGAKPIYYTKKALPSNAYWVAGDIIDFIYDGTNWNIITETSPRADKLTTARYIDGITFNGASNIHHYGTCSTAAGTAAKTANVNGGNNFSLVTGAKIYIKFSATNTVDNPTLNINSTGAKNIYYQGAALTIAQSWEAGETVPFIYDGTNWNMITAPAPRAEKLSTTRYIDGVAFNGTADIHHYGVCTTQETYVAKVATVNDGNGLDANNIKTGTKITIQFSYGNTASNPTLNVNSTGAKPIFAQGVRLPSTWFWKANDTINFVYDGTNWVMTDRPNQYDDIIVCGAGQSVTAKTATASHFILNNIPFKIKFTNANTASNPTLNINNTGAKSIYYRGYPISTHMIEKNFIYTMQYDNDRYNILTTPYVMWGIYDSTEDKNWGYGQQATAEGRCNSPEGECSHVEGFKNIAAAIDAHAEGYWNLSGGASSHAEGNITMAAGKGAHSEGNNTIAHAEGAHAEGTGTSQYIYLTNNAGSSTIYTYSEDSEIEDLKVGDHISSINYNTKTVQSINTSAKTITVSGTLGHLNNARCYYSKTGAFGHSSHVEGYCTTAYGSYSHAEGNSTIAHAVVAHAEGYKTTALANQHAQGHFNDTSKATAGEINGTSGTAFVIGNGTHNTVSNACRITYAGAVIGKAAYQSTGADYAEYFEWADSNIENEERIGYFVTFEDGRFIRKANENDYILGIVSGNPCVLGNNDECWMGQNEMDEWGRFIYETKIETNEITGETYEYQTYKVNPNYNSNLQYIPRSERPEWDSVGMLGVLAVRDDGTCQVNSYCKVSNGGIATASNQGYRVIERINDNIIKIVFR